MFKLGRILLVYNFSIRSWIFWSYIWSISVHSWNSWCWFVFSYLSWIIWVVLVIWSFYVWNWRVVWINRYNLTNLLVNYFEDLVAVILTLGVSCCEATCYVLTIRLLVSADCYIALN